MGMKKGHENDPVGAGQPGPRFVTSLARTTTEVREAQRLRHLVFAEELGARLDSAAERLDRDRFDDYCAHLLVRSADTGEVVGTYRILTAADARRAGGFYSEQEFDLGAIPSLPRVVEIGRACVHPDHRSGAVLGLLWGALAQHFRLHGHEHVIGCASLPAREDPSGVASVCDRLLGEHGTPPAWRARPRRPFVAPPSVVRAPIPAAIRGYLHMGAAVCGEPAWDPDFGTADLLLLLSLARMSGRFAHRLLRAA
jgi:putative hemolysin